MWSPEAKRYNDPATDFPMVRVTDPQFSCGLTAPHLRQFNRQSSQLLYWSDRSGSIQAFTIDLKTYESRQVTEAAKLDPTALSFSQDDKNFYWFDGPSLFTADLDKLRSRELHRIPDGATREGFSIGTDGVLWFFEKQAGKTRLMRANRTQTMKAADIDGDAQSLQVRPRRPQVLWRIGDAVWMSDASGSGARALKLASGRVGHATWSPSGRTLLYLHVPEDPKQLVTLREFTPEDGTDKELGRTSQYISFSPNLDASVFTGASRSKAAQYVLILLRVTHREMAICEHHASDPAMVMPVFSPDSQSIFFTSDRHGKPAIYRIRVEKFVEDTGPTQ